MDLVSTLILLSLAVPAVSDGDWVGADRVVVVLPFASTPAKAGRALADALQLRLRSKLETAATKAYVLSWPEMEIYLGAATLDPNTDAPTIARALALSDRQKMILVRGTLTLQAAGSARAELVVSQIPPDQPEAKQTFELADEKWKPKLSEQMAQYIAREFLALPEPTQVPATRPTRWGTNLVPNGRLGQGKGFQPHGWDSADGLCSFWIAEGKKNHYLLFDTDVSQNQAWDWWKALKNGAKPENAPQPIRTHPPHYDAVGGIEGVKLYSDYLRARPGTTYRLTARIKGPDQGRAKIFVKGYALLPTAKSDRPVRREVWQTYLHCDIRGEAWKTYELVFTLPGQLPAVEKTTRRPKTETTKTKTYPPKLQWLRIMPFAYWVVGKYYIDDITLQPALP